MSGGGMGNTSLMGGGQGGGMGRFGGFNDPYNQPKGRFGGSPYGGFGGSPFGGMGRLGGSPFGGMQKPFNPGGGMAKPFYPGGGGDSIGDAGFGGMGDRFSQFQSLMGPGGDGSQVNSGALQNTSPSGRYQYSNPLNAGGNDFQNSLAGRFQMFQQQGGNGSPFNSGALQNQPPGRGAATPGGYRGPVGDFVGGNVIDNLTPRTPGTSFRGPARVPDEMSVQPPPPPPVDAMAPEMKGGLQANQKPFVPDGGMGQPGQYAPPNPGGDSMGLQPPPTPNSGQQAYDNALSQYNSPEYAAYYNSLAPSTRAYMNAPGSAQTGQYLGDMARNNYNAFGAYPWSR